MRKCSLCFALIVYAVTALKPRVFIDRILSGVPFLRDVTKLSSQHSTHRKVVIIGSGPAGSTAAIYSARAMLKPLHVTGYSPGGQLMLTSDVENFPGYREPISGPNLISDLHEQARRFGTDTWQTDCVSVDLRRRPFLVVLGNATVTTDALIISTGANAQWLHADREEEFKGKGISTCATCDGFLFRDKSVVVVGGGDSALEEAMFLTRFVSSVTVVHRRKEFRASKIMLARAKANPKISFLVNTEIKGWHGDSTGALSGFSYRDVSSGETHEMACQGAFLAIGHKPNTAFLGGQVLLDNNGYIKLKQHTMTNVSGVFACGDVADSRYRQAITAAGTGCQAAIDAERWLENQLQENILLDEHNH